MKLYLTVITCIIATSGLTQIESKGYIYFTINVEKQKNYFAYILNNTKGVYLLPNQRGAIDSVFVDDSAVLFISLKSTRGFTIYNYIPLLEKDSVIITDTKGVLKVSIANRKVNDYEMNFPLLLNNSYIGIDLNMEKLAELKITSDSDTIRIKKMHIASIKYLDSLKQEKLISESFCAIKKVEFMCNYHKLLLAANPKKQLQKISDFIKQTLNKGEYTTSSSYIELSLSYSRILYKNKFPKINNEIKFQQFASTLFTQDISAKVIKRSMGGYMAFSRDNLDSKKKTLKIFLSITKDSTTYSQYLFLLSSSNKLIRQNTKDTLLDITGSYHLLDSVLYKARDKLILVDLWASWCAPCRAEMPASLNLRSKLKEKTIVFIYLSIDDNVRAWHKASKEEGLNDYENNYLLLNFQSTLIARQLNISSIPRYILIDKNGKIVNANAPRPGDPALISMLNEHSDK